MTYLYDFFTSKLQSPSQLEYIFYVSMNQTLTKILRIQTIFKNNMNKIPMDDEIEKAKFAMDLVMYALETELEKEYADPRALKLFERAQIVTIETD